MKKNYKKILVRYLALLFIVLLGVFIFLKRSVAPLDGTAQLKNLSAPVKVIRDEYGIPHIFAQTKKDSLRALGFVMASERLFQMEMARRMTQGTLSELVGEVGLRSDKLYRSLGLRHTVEQMLAEKMKSGKYDEKMMAEMEAYCDGVNQYMATHPLPPELVYLRDKPRPFTPLDAYIMTGHMAFSFGVALRNDVLMTSLAKKLTPEMFQDLRNDQLKTPIKITEALHLLEPLMIAKENKYAPYFDGSNSWLLAPKRSRSGKSIFSNDPHIGYSLPAVWFEAHIHTPEFELYGHYLPMVPFAVLGHSRHHAWGFTMSETDDMDLYKERLDREKKMVMSKGRWQPYSEWNEIIVVKNKPDVSFKMIETPHGFLMDEVLDQKNIALKWAFNSPHNDTMATLYHMGEAKNITEFENSLKDGTAPGLNVMYADPQNIAWWTYGEIAIKKNPNSDVILDGSTGEDDYDHMMAWEDKPHEVNPDSGFIVTANSRPASAPAELRGDWQADDRLQTITSALKEKDKWTAEEMKTLQTENFNINTTPILDHLLQKLQLDIKEQSKYASLLVKLKKWNRHSEIDSQEAAFYHQWNNENLAIILANLDPQERESYLHTTHAWIFYKRILKNENSPWWKNKDQTTVITEGFKRALAKWEHLPIWGDIHRITYKHPFGDYFPMNLLLNVGPRAIPGAYNEINNNKQRGLSGNFDVVAGPSTRRIIDFALPQKSWGINPLGVSGHVLSPYYSDEAKLFIEGKYRPQLMDEDDIRNNKRHELTLQ
ncbi:MAG TPA: penicillin acylase family protein [Bdellovibrio sp.]|uniref:penicillin acylase family protein n=1 Tax=Bdellovibrio sp. TaxID=28201 RepID=UPI002F044BAB